MKQIGLAVILCILGVNNANSQVYSEKKTKHRFAQSYIGLNTQYIPGSGQVYFGGEAQSFNPMLIPRLNLGGLHFWGHLDFNMNIPLTRIGSEDLKNGNQIYFNSGADLSARYYPWALKNGAIRPFTGVSFNTMSLGLESEQIGERFEGFIAYSLLGGISYSFQNWQINAEIMFLPNETRPFYSDRDLQENISLPNSYFSLGIARLIDFTLPEEEHLSSGRTEKLKNAVLKNKSLNSLSIGFAANGSYSLRSPSFKGEWKSLPEHKGSFNWEYSIGYLLDKPDLHFGLTYRNYQSTSYSYGLEHVIRREALSLEAFKFIWDYNGFVPFVGFSLSAERWAAGLFKDDILQGNVAQSELISPGIIFGWDIRPSAIDTWVLRTNLRYYPQQEINDALGGKSRIDQFEFNFIQFVFYPNRWWKLKTAKKRLGNA